MESRIKADPKSTASPALSFSFLALSFFVSSQNAFSIVGLPVLLKEGSITAPEMGWLLGVYPFAAAAAAFVSGPVSDLYGRRKLLITGQLVFSAALILHIFASQFGALFFARLLAGACSGLLAGLPSTLASDHYTRFTLQKVISRNLFGYALGHVIGLPLGIFLLQHASFQTLSAGIGICSLATLPLLARSLPACIVTSKPRFSNICHYFSNTLSLKRNPQISPLSAISFLNFFATSLFQISFILWLSQTMSFTPNEIAPIYLVAGIGQSVVFLCITTRLHLFAAHKIILSSFMIHGLLYFIGSGLSLSTAAMVAVFTLTLATTALRIPSWHTLVATCGKPDSKGFRMSLSQTSGLAGKACGAFAASLLFQSFDIAILCALSAVLLLSCPAILAASHSLRQVSPLKSKSNSGPSEDAHALAQT